MLADGRFVLLNSNILTVYDPSSDETVNLSLSRNYNFLQISENKIYSASGDNGINNSQSIFSIDITDLENVVETNVYDAPSNHYFNYEFSVEGENILFNEYDSDNDVRRIYKKEGSSSPELLITTTQWGSKTNSC